MAKYTLELSNDQKNLLERLLTFREGILLRQHSEEYDGPSQDGLMRQIEDIRCIRNQITRG